jgi:hypothetical protein
MSYFTNFPQIDYFFGNKVKPTRFTDLHVYIDLIDQIKDDVSVYTYYNLQDGDRPDQISQKLYGTTDYHWTLYLLNDDVRLHGWPLSYNDMKEKAEEDYPNTVLLTRNNLDNKFKVGTKVRGLTSGVEGTILKRSLDFGQIIIQGTKSFTAGEIISATENDSVVTATIDAVVVEYNAIHHYEDDSARYVDVEPTAPFAQESEGKFLLFDSGTSTYNLTTIYSTLSAANTDKTGIEVVREVDVFRLIDKNNDVISTAPLGVTFNNSVTEEFDTYFDNSVGTSYSDSADATTSIKNLFDTYIVANYNDIEPALLTPVTYFERVKKENESKLQIKVIKPDVIEDVINSFNNIVLEAEENTDPIVITNGQKGLGTFKTTLRT